MDHVIFMGQFHGIHNRWICIICKHLQGYEYVHVDKRAFCVSVHSLCLHSGSSFVVPAFATVQDASFVPVAGQVRRLGMSD